MKHQETSKPIKAVRLTTWSAGTAELTFARLRLVPNWNPERPLQWEQGLKWHANDLGIDSAFTPARGMSQANVVAGSGTDNDWFGIMELAIADAYEAKEALARGRDEVAGHVVHHIIAINGHRFCGSGNHIRLVVLALCASIPRGGE
jgi:hypothetical protein